MSEEINWADVPFSDEEEESQFSVGDFLINHPISTVPIDNVSVDKCNCLLVEDINDAVFILTDSYFSNLHENYQCKLENLIRVVNFSMQNYSDIESPERLFICDWFYRYRHEFLCSIVKSMLNLPEGSSDEKFSNYGVDSERTPDIIVQVGTVLFIIEVTAGSSFEKMAMTKGLESLGFESKYQKELDILKSQSRPYQYIPLLFNMSQINNLDFLKEIEILSGSFVINKISEQILKYSVKELCSISLGSKDYFAPMAAILFSKSEFWEKDHSDLEFFYTCKGVENERHSYKELCVSAPVYNRLLNNWSRLLVFLEKGYFKDNSRILPILDISNGRFTFEENKSGVSLMYLEQILDRNDKLSFLQILNLKVGDRFIKATESETGVKFVERTTLKVIKPIEEIVLRHGHLANKNVTKMEFSMTNYFIKINAHFKDVYNPIHYDIGYEDLLIDKITEFDISVNNLDPDKPYFTGDFLKNENLLGNSELSEVNINEVIDNFIKIQISNNKFDDSLPVKKQKTKVPFLIPLSCINQSSYSNLKFKNVSFLNSIKESIINTNPYTLLIIEKILEPSFEFIREKNSSPSDYHLKLQKERIDLSNKLSALYTKNVILCKKTLSNLRMKNSPDQEIRKEFTFLSNKLSLINKEINKNKKKENLLNETELIRLPTKNKNTNLGQLFAAEMSHYKKRTVQSVVSGVGYRQGIEEDFDNDKRIFDNLSEFLTENAGDNPDLFFENIETQDVKLLSDLKKAAADEYMTIIKSIKDSYLGHASALVSRLAHSLLYYSQMPFSSDYIRADNLGYKDVLLIVKGGKKIFKSKSSKFFRLIYPIPECVIDWYFTGFGDNPSHSIFDYSGKKYLITPWAQWNESILNDSISFYSRVVSFNVLNLDQNKSFQQQFNKVSLNTLLAFHNRRKTEVILANLRYILLSTLGDYTGIAGIFKEFSGFNYDCFQSFIRSCIIKNYPKFFDKLKYIKKYQDESSKFQINFSIVKSIGMENIFSGSNIMTEDDLALMIYSTFLMTKAPYQRPVERANNLKGILEIHEYYKESFSLDCNLESLNEKTSVSLNNEMSYDEYCSKLFKNDFNFDPKFCSTVGNFVDSLMDQKDAKDRLHLAWIKILQESWDEMATSTGLRGKYTDLEDFWGQKGYFIVYKEFALDKVYLNNVKKMLCLDMTFDEKRKILRELNVMYKDKMNNQLLQGKDQEFLIFHAVDKVQWRGGREIYVMDVFTKTRQQPIEKFMAEVCKMFDNELISIPSDRRAQVIHHTIFEKDLPLKDVLTWYLTLDCSKWAPKSNFLKFIPTILSMKCIPSSFKTHFLNYLQLLYNKRIYFNNLEVEVLSKNPQYKSLIEENLIKDNNVNGYYLKMPYSWVMGIFNYTSSFLHAANQKYFSYILFKSTLNNYKEECTLTMFAHSDDSGGRITTKNKNLIKRALIHYEISLKSCNHLLSKKKSVVSRLYFEILSVIYLFKKLLALLPKFLGGLRFLPTDKGPAQDMLQSYSKCIEVMVAGANFSKAYLVMKFYSYLIFRFYYNRNPTLLDFQSPVQYLGLPDAHPLMVLICGSEADIIRLIKANRSVLIKQICFVNSLTDSSESEGPIKPIKFAIRVRGIKKTFQDSIDFLENEIKDWPINNVNFRNTPFNFLSFLKKLNDPGFIGSLVNESTTRRISRSFFLRSGDGCITVKGNLKLKFVKDSINLVTSYALEKNTVNRKLIHNLLEGVFGHGSIENIDKQFSLNMIDVENQIEIYEHVSSSPLKILKYLDQLSLKGREIVSVERTLKPTHLEISKTAKVFSNRFDPAQMVSYIKFPQYNWALPNLSGLETAKTEVTKLCEELNLNIDKMTPDILLKLCRVYSDRSSKEIYMYSQVPSEIRSIRTYSSLLTFLSVNSYHNKEIRGLVLDIQKNYTAPGFTPTNINEDIYLLNNVLSLVKIICELFDSDKLSEINLKEFHEIGWKGGSLIDYVNYCEKFLYEDDNLCYLILQIGLIKTYLNTGKLSKNIGGEYIKNSCFYTFLKTQKSNSGWYGKGEIMFYITGNFYLFEIYNTYVISLKTNYMGKIKKKDLNFIMDGLKNSKLSLRPNDMLKGSKIKTEMAFGIDIANDFYIGESRYISKGYPCFISPFSGTFVDKLEFYNVTFLRNSSFLLKASEMIDPVTRKIYTIEVQTGDMINTIKRVLDFKQFEDYIIQEGLNDFEDFIYSEILTKYGAEVYIDFNNLMDNYLGSKTYQIFRDCQINSWSKLPKKMDNKILPVNETGISRIIHDYSTHSNDSIVSITKNLSPVIMSLRSEYPEDVSVILSSKLVEFYDKIYNGSEKNEIYEDYSKLSSCDNVEEARKLVIKFMRYWGYGSLINTIEIYTLSTNDVNYNYFNLGVSNLEHPGVLIKVFISLHNIICETMLEFETYYKNLEFPIKELVERYGMVQLIKQYNKSIALSVENYKKLISNCSFYKCQFFNLLIALLKDEEFVVSLNQKLKKDYILSSIPANFKNRNELIIMYNTLICLYFRFESKKVNRNYLLRNDRSADEMNSFFSNYKKITKMGQDYNDRVRLHPAENYYGGFLDNDIISIILERPSIEFNGYKVRVDSKLVKRSTTKVPPNKIIKIIRPLNEDFIDSEEWEELAQELDFEDVDEDTIIDLWGSCDNHFDKTETKFIHKKSKIINTKINWLIAPNIEGFPKFENYVRQAGENIIILTNCFVNKLLWFPNSHLRLINFNKNIKNDSFKKPTMLAYVICNKLLNNEFWNKYLGGRILNINEDILDILKYDTVKEEEGASVKMNKIGKEVTEKDFMDQTDKGDENGEDLEEKNEECQIENPEEENLKLLEEMIEEAWKLKIISKASMNHMKNKYIKNELIKVFDINMLMKNCITEIELNKVQKIMESGDNKILKLTKESIVNIYDSPGYFGAAFKHNKSENKTIKDRRFKAEVESFYTGISAKIGSDKLFLNDEMASYLKSNLKLWANTVKVTKYKKESKNFCLLFALSIINSAKPTGLNGQSNDEIWNSLIRRTTDYIADDGPEEEENNDLFSINLSITPTSRATYKPIGF